MRDFSVLWNQAVEAGNAAAAALVPVPMTVVNADLSGRPLPGAQRYFVADGVCGFAWITVRPGNSPFANWAKKAGVMRPAYGGGVQHWVSAFDQSMQRKEAFAEAAANVLRTAGVKAYAGSRMD
jgi:hypothetical protein